MFLKNVCKILSSWKFCSLIPNWLSCKILGIPRELQLNWNAFTKHFNLINFSSLALTPDTWTHFNIARMIKLTFSFFTILIRILLVPVIEKNGTYIFKLCSLRSFISFVLWSAGPMFLVILLFWVDFDFLFGLGFSASLSNFINYGTIFIVIGCVPILLGHLVASVDIELLDFITQRNWEIIFISVLLWESTNFALVSNGTLFAISFPFRIVHGVFILISLVTMKMLTSAFCNFCEMEGNFNVSEMIDHAEDCWAKYRSLKKGFSPFIFVMYSIHTLHLVVEAYRYPRMYGRTVVNAYFVFLLGAKVNNNKLRISVVY